MSVGLDNRDELVAVRDGSGYSMRDGKHGAFFTCRADDRIAHDTLRTYRKLRIAETGSTRGFFNSLLLQTKNTTPVEFFE